MDESGEGAPGNAGDSREEVQGLATPSAPNWVELARADDDPGAGDGDFNVGFVSNDSPSGEIVIAFVVPVSYFSVSSCGTGTV